MSQQHPEPTGADKVSLESTLPLAGIRVLEFTHMVMGPTCGMILGDLGAEVIKVEPLAGDNTRKLLGSGAGFFTMFNRNKKSIAIDIKSPEGLAIIQKLLPTIDVFSENFKTGTMQQYGLDHDTLKEQYPELIYVSHKGFLPGPYEHRTALDEVVQMMGGLAYMTGPKGQPLRAGTSVNDIMGGMFGAMGVIVALFQRQKTGKGQTVLSSLFENNIFLIGQHMLQYAVTGKPADPMPSRISSWGIYDVFEVKDQEQIFLAVVSDTQWDIFCRCFGYHDLFLHPDYQTNNARVIHRDTLIPELRKRLRTLPADQVAQLFEDHGLPYAPISKPHELFDDEHLNATGGLADVRLQHEGPHQGKFSKVPLLPLSMDGQRLGLRLQPPSKGEHTSDLLMELGYTQDEIQGLKQRGIVL